MKEISEGARGSRLPRRRLRLLPRHRGHPAAASPCRPTGESGAVQPRGRRSAWSKPRARRRRRRRIHDTSRLRTLAAATAVGMLTPRAADGRRLLVLLGARGRPFQEPEKGEKVTVLCSELIRIRQNVEGFDIFRIILTVVKATNRRRVRLRNLLKTRPFS